MKKKMIVALAKHCIQAFVWNLGKILTVFRRKKKNTPGRIMVIRTDRIGDFVLFMPALKWLRKKYCDSYLVLVVQDIVSGLAETTPCCDAVIDFNESKYKRNLIYKFDFLFRLFRCNIDLCLCPAYSRYRMTDEMALWSGAVEKIAWDTKLPNMSVSELNRGNCMYSRLLSSSLGTWVHEVERNREWLELLKIPAADYLFSFMVPNKNIPCFTGIDEFFMRKIRIAIVPGAGAEYRKWGNSNFVILMRRLLQIRSDIGFVIIGNEDDRFAVAEMGIGDLKSNYVDLCGRILLQDLAKVYAVCHLVIGNEAGPMHLAIASGVQTLTILGGGHFGRFMPYGDALKNRFVFKRMDCYQCDWHCIYLQTRCIREIGIDDVLHPAKAMLFSTVASNVSIAGENIHPEVMRK